MRLLRAVDQAMLAIGKDELLVVQKGVSDYNFAYLYTRIYKELSFNKMLYYFKKARVVISSGGPATIYLTLKYGRNKPLVVPRLLFFSEHVDDHELFFTRFLGRRKKIVALDSKKNLSKIIADYLFHPLPSKKNLRWKPKELITHLDQYSRWLEQN